MLTVVTPAADRVKALRRTRRRETAGRDQLCRVAGMGRWDGRPRRYRHKVLGYVVGLGGSQAFAHLAALPASRGWGGDWLAGAVAGRRVVQFGLVSETAVRFVAADRIA